MCCSTIWNSPGRNGMKRILMVLQLAAICLAASFGFINGKDRLSGQKKRNTATQSEPFSTQFLQPITARIGDCLYLYIQYGISITLDYINRF